MPEWKAPQFAAPFVVTEAPGRSSLSFSSSEHLDRFFLKWEHSGTKSSKYCKKDRESDPAESNQLGEGLARLRSLPSIDLPCSTMRYRT